MDNPFSPTFGSAPPALGGRTDIIEDFSDALAVGPHHPSYTMLLTGFRGMGKTVLLDELADCARQLGWVVLSDDTVDDDWLERLCESVARELQARSPEEVTRITGLEFAGLGVTFDLPERSKLPSRLRELLTSLASVLEENGTGLLVSLDELQSADLAEVRSLGAALQHVTRREGHRVALLSAALPSLEDSIEADQQEATFLQRLDRRPVGRLRKAEAADALKLAILEAGASISDEALELAVEASRGHPFLVQLIGFHTWKAADPSLTPIGLEDVRLGVQAARSRFGRNITRPVWQGLSDLDRKFLMAMAIDGERSSIGRLAARIERSEATVGQYRLRLLRTGLIEPAGRGFVRFIEPDIREYIGGTQEFEVFAADPGRLGMAD